MNVDVAKVREIADSLVTSAEELRGGQTAMHHCRFGPAHTGAQYADAGRRIDDGLVRVSELLTHWHGATEFTAATLRAMVDRIVAEDEESATTIGRAVR
ncbi:hypothetical protein FOS14_01560 [Skermania sp. ID1734]|uniref:hypothetical protein n=1 Tax=Skermania sp. ID1734 TaxID=2597516 RepID=UPI00117F07C4|nr:hypothetical protein [Skermania sp. ID1734]TSE02096.1 hypothetical protein FOS14_01560 [Skermania sp. ID1734]